jgi:arginine/lysine/ornithine decarboxylase
MKSSQKLFEKLSELRHKNQVSFHVPGHKFGRGLSELLAQQALSLESLDYTEIPGTDNLHAPEGVILTAQNEAARIFGALETQFLVGGTTSGILGAILGTVPRGAKLILPRDAHKSVLSAVLLGGIEPVFVMPEIDKTAGISLGLSADKVQEAVRRHPDAAAILVTYPNYEGVACDLRSIIKLAHYHGLIVIVDEAHGSHLGLSRDLPETALSLGADLAVQSTHKTLTSLTQSSMLHYGTERGLSLKPRISAYLSMVQSSSPSYPLMLSLELAAGYYETKGPEEMQRLMALIDGFYKSAVSMGYKFMHDQMTWPEGFSFDKTRLVISGCDLGMDGYQLYEALEMDGVIGEYATPLYVVLIPSIVSEASDFHRLTSSLGRIAETTSPHSKSVNSFEFNVTNLKVTELPKRGVSPEQALWAEQERIPLSEAKGRIAADFLIPYPPGIPLLVPGEIISEEVLRIVLSDLGIQHKVNGLADGRFAVLKHFGK